LTVPEVLSALGDSARAARMLTIPDSSAASALAYMTAAGLTLYQPQMLAQFQAGTNEQMGTVTGTAQVDGQSLTVTGALT